MAKPNTDFTAKAKAAWGAPLPDWIEELAKACAAKGQATVAADLGVSPAMVSTVLGKTYAGKTETLEGKVRAVYFADKVVCPELGELSLLTCQENQDHAKKGNRGSSLRARMARACISGKCVHSRISKGDR